MSRGVVTHNLLYRGDKGSDVGTTLRYLAALETKTKKTAQGDWQVSQEQDTEGAHPLLCFSKVLAASGASATFSHV